MLARAATIPGRGHYFDLLEFEKFWEKHQTPTTPAVSLVYALVEQCRHVAEEGVEARAARHGAMRDRCVAWVEAHGARWGLSLFAPEGCRSPTVTCIRVDGPVPAPEIVARLKARGWTIGGGYGSLKDTTIRIGHMGDHTVDGLNALLAELEGVLG
jgi:aspartate aminotransferase-like enzyme